MSGGGGSWLRGAVPLLAGVLFAVGLGLGGMTNPAKILAFLDVLERAGPWDPSLGFFMAGALLVHLPFVQWTRRRERLGAAAAGPTTPPRRIDAALVAGAAIFGVGWGLSGLCPGPAFVSLARPGPGLLLFLGALFVGLALARLLGRQPA